MRNRGICPKCSHREVLVIAHVRETVAPLNVRDFHLLSQNELEEGGYTVKRAGKLSAAVCRACGYVEWYVIDPASIPVDGVAVTLVSSAEQGPFR